MKQSNTITGISILPRLVSFAVIFVSIMIAGCQTTPPPRPYQAPKDAVGESGRPHVFLSATEMAEAIRNGDISSLELVRKQLAHIYLHNPELNTIVIMDEEAVLKRAKEADDALSRGERWGPLHGVPVTITDQFALRNMLTTNAHPDLREQITLFDATVVKRMKDAGAIILGKTNLSIYGMDWQANNVIFGKTANPWDPDRTSGGSAGGSAAVAAGLSPIDIGSDIGGSLRVPAHFTGTYSFKPTENTVSNYGIMPGLFDPDERRVRHMISIGPVTRSIEDLQLAFDIIKGPDEKDPLVTPVKKWGENDKPSIDSLRIAWSSNFGDIPVTRSTRDVMDAFMDRIRDAGGSVVRVDPEMNFNDAWATWGKMIDMQLMAGQTGEIRLFSFLFGWSYRARTPLLQMVYPLSTEEYVRVLTQRDHIVAGFDRFLSDWDVFICPVATRSAIKHYSPDAIRNHMPIYTRPIMVDGHKLNYYTAMGAYATLFNLTGNPVVTIPAGFTPEGLPVGLQIVGKRWEDLKLLDIAAILDKVAGDYRRPDGY